MIAAVDGSTRNSSAAYFNTAVNGVVSGTLKLKKVSQLIAVNRYSSIILFLGPSPRQTT